MYAISIQAGFALYCSPKEDKAIGYDTVEVAALDPDGEFYKTSHNTGDVIGWASLDKLIAILTEIEAY